MEEANKGHSIGVYSGDQEMGIANVFKDEDIAADQESTTHNFPRKKDLDFARMVVAEMVGTFVVMFSICGIIASTELTKGEVGLLEYASTGGFAIIVVIFAIGPISGAHMNPSITIAFATLGQFPWCRVPIYVTAQMLGSVSATYVGKFVYNMHADFANTRPVHGLKTAFWAELIATSFIMFLASALSSNAQSVGQLSPVAVGAAIALGVLITGPVSGGSMNPARSFGPAVVSWKFDHVWLYLVAPTIGAVVGAHLFRLLRLQPRHCHPTPF
ncbi:probable aquaporin NIP7-1 isoform X1 [Magnolia sinica]|uniref:probable aquaporin NIP7-1 isoform X1 n=1 Tax=Magnolia sinica TaxID=86752 RepID=UPI00265B3E6C|nr:probable aquaporin NIP7-1 isoform X1 [Magnolia sinica]